MAGTEVLSVGQGHEHSVREAEPAHVPIGGPAHAPERKAHAVRGAPDRGAARRLVFCQDAAQACAADQFGDGGFAVERFLGPEEVEKLYGQHGGSGDVGPGFGLQPLEAFLLVGDEPAIEASLGNIPQLPARVAKGLLDDLADGLGQTHAGQDPRLDGRDQLIAEQSPWRELQPGCFGHLGGASLQHPHGSQKKLRPGGWISLAVMEGASGRAPAATGGRCGVSGRVRTARPDPGSHCGNRRRETGRRDACLEQAF